MVYKFERIEAIRAMRGKIWSPGQPSTALRENRVRFWQAIGGGPSTEDAPGDAGVSPAVGSRWFRDAGGMPALDLAPVSGPYLSFAEREEIAILHAQHVGVREIARRLGRSPRRRSVVRCAAMRRLAATSWRIGHRRLTGMRSGGPVARTSPSLPPMTVFVSMSRIVLPR